MIFSAILKNGDVVTSVIAPKSRDIDYIKARIRSDLNRQTKGCAERRKLLKQWEADGEMIRTKE